MTTVVVVGAQWGDEGKGKVIDLFAEGAQMVVRYAGGANAGHTLVVRGEKHVLHLVPSGILHPKTRCVIAQGAVIDPATLLREIQALEAAGVPVRSQLLVSDRAHVVLPQHLLVDGLREKGAGAIGTTKRGIGPAYEDKAGRVGIRIRDLLDRARLEPKLRTNFARWEPSIRSLGGELPSIETTLALCLEQGERLRPFLGDASRAAHASIVAGDDVLLEGAQGTLLDMDHGTYPFVTSSSTVAGGACTGIGIGPTSIDRVIGITKAYATRVGNGPFPTELHGSEGDRIRETGGEYGATTGRPRRCGWLDIPALRYAIRVNGIGALAVTKLDVLSGLPSIPLCVAYTSKDGAVEELDPEDTDHLAPVYEELPGWSEPVDRAKTLDDLPSAARAYLNRIEALTGCPIELVSIGPERDQTIVLKNPFAAQ